MRRLLAPIAVALAATVATSACGAVADDVAATVGGKDISVAEVAKLAKTDYIGQNAQQSGTGLVQSAPGSTGSARQRVALGLLVQTSAMEREVKKRKITVTDEDRQAAEQQVSSQEQQAASAGSSIDALARQQLLRLFTAQYALVRAQGGLEVDPPTEAEIVAYFTARADQYGGVRTCLDGFATPASEAATLQARVDAGDTVATILADTSLQVQPLVPGGAETCVPVGQVKDPTLGKLVDEAPVGRWSTANLTDPQAGEVTIFVRPNSRGEIGLDNASVREEVTAAAQQDKQNRRYSELSDRLRAVFDTAGVQIDSRYGTWNPKAGAIDAPPVPKPPATAPDALPQTIPAAPATAGA